MGNINSLSIILPAFNEEDNLEPTMAHLIETLEKCNLDWQIILINDGSTDRTGEIVQSLTSGQLRIMVIHHKQNMGIGYCFREGIRNANKDIVTWLPADGENNPEDLFKYLILLEQTDIVVPFVRNTQIRPLLRRFLSKFYIWIINLSFGTKFNYTNGNILYRRKIFDNIALQSDGFFFQTECLIKAINKGYKFIEVPVYLKERRCGFSKAITIKHLCVLIKEFIMLFFVMHGMGFQRKFTHSPNDASVGG